MAERKKKVELPVPTLLANNIAEVLAENCTGAGDHDFDDCVKCADMEEALMRAVGIWYGFVRMKERGHPQDAGRAINCYQHPGTVLICPKCQSAKGGSRKSRQKAKASRENGKLGGRPRKKQG